MMYSLLQSPMGRLRIVAFLEGCSFLLIFFTMYLKYGLNMPKPNYVVGMAHGLFFVAYIFLVLQVGQLFKWRFKEYVFAFAASIVPGGTFYADKKLFVPGKL